MQKAYLKYYIFSMLFISVMKVMESMSLLMALKNNLIKLFN